MIDHQPYERLFELAATGQLSASEKDTFDEHCLHCAACRHHLQELAFINHQLLLHTVTDTTLASMPTGSLERFRSRAIREGIALRPASARPSMSYLLASATAALIVIAMLTLLPHTQKVLETAQLSTSTSILTQQNPSTVVTPQIRATRFLQANHAHSTRRTIVPHTSAEINTINLAPQRFPQVIAASYPLFESQNTQKPSPIGYPALSRSQVLHLDPFPALDHASNPNIAGIATLDSPIASTGKVFDFAVNIRQLHFQLPIAQ